MQKFGAVINYRFYLKLWQYNKELVDYFIVDMNCMYSSMQKYSAEIQIRHNSEI